MRRTTICRSDRAVLLALAALPLMWRVLPVQDTTTEVTKRPRTAAALLQGQVPSSHAVSRGETLWSISKMASNDPLLWPENSPQGSGSLKYIGEMAQSVSPRDTV